MEKGNKGNLVEQYKIGNTTIKIYDSAYINKTEKTVVQIIARIEALGRRVLITTRL